MRTSLIAMVCCCMFALTATGEGPSDGRDLNWAQWRGPDATGTAPHGNPPVEWSESKNIRWKVEIPGLGHATPIVWGDRVYVQTAVKTDKEVKQDKPAEPQEPREEGRRGRRGRRGHPGMGGGAPTHVYQFALIALDRRTGKVVWQKTLCEEVPHEGGHQDASQASASPVTDGTHIIAHFGSRGLYCLDMAGDIVWKKELGQMQTRREFGEGSSPALFGDTVVVVWDHEGQSFIVALDKATGKQKWKADRDEVTSWATPLIVTVDGKPQVIASATDRIRSYDLKTGKVLWQCGGMTTNAIPSPVHDSRHVYATSGFRGSALLAIRYADATGDITDSATVAWSYDGKGTPYVPSAVLHKGSLYFLDTNKAMLSCVDAATGKAHYAKQRLEGLQGVYASPVAASGRVYIAGRGGKAAVVGHGNEFKLLATNELDEGFSASPAIAGDELYLRGRSHLYCIAAD